MQTTTTKTRWDLTRRICLVVSILVFTWVYQGTAVYDGAAAFVCSIAFIACFNAFSNAVNTRLKTLTTENFVFLRVPDVVLTFLVCLCMTLETLILHRPFTF